MVSMKRQSITLEYDDYSRLETALTAAAPPLCDALNRQPDWVSVQVTNEDPERSPGMLLACERQAGHPGDHMTYRPDLNAIVSWKPAIKAEEVAHGAKVAGL